MFGTFGGILLLIIVLAVIGVVLSNRRARANQYVVV
jgi:hypothetical protein